MRYALDTNIWIYAAVDKTFARLLERFVPVGLSAVVASELARAQHGQAHTMALSIIKRFAHTLLVPTADDWLATAHALRDVCKHHHYEDHGSMKLQNDALIAVSAARAGWTVVTTNRVDFERLNEQLAKRRCRCVFLDAPQKA